MSNKGKLLLLLFDGNAMVHRAFHALPPLTVSKTGEMVNAVYGFANTLLKELAELKPTHWAVAFDRPTPTFRHEIFQEYKAQRPKAPEELKSQIKRVHQLVAAFHIPIFEMDGFEADDILGTLSKQASEQAIETIIVTGDNDILQLVMPGVKTLAPRRSFSETVLYDEEAVEQKYGIKPGQITDFKALVGDASDNIPGIPGIGEKTAARLIQKHGSLEGIYKHIEYVTPDKLQKILSQHQPQAFQSNKLVTIVRDVPVTLSLEACQITNYDRDKVVEFFRELEFLKLVPRLPQGIREGTSPLPTALSGGVCHIVNEEASLNELISQMEGANEIATDLETTGKEATIVGIAISPAPGRAFYIPLGHRGLNQPAQLPLAQVIASLRPILESTDKGRIAYNGKHNISVLANYEVELRNLNFDIMIAAYLLGEKTLSLQALAFDKLGIEIKSLSDLIGTGKKQVS